MDDYWATRTGRLRKAMKSQIAPTLADRLYRVIRTDVEARQLPAGAVLPTPERVAEELSISAADVQAAYERLGSDGLVEDRGNGRLCIAGENPDASVGDATQIRFETALLKAVREAAARGLSASEATGMFKAALVRMAGMERPTEVDD